jgi:signal transduction histidine kinase/ActR/RegA family two-component response regulator
MLVAVPLSICFLALVGESFRLISPNEAKHASDLPTLLTVLMLQLGFLLARPDRGWMGILTGPGLGGALARRLLPFTVVVPFAGLWLRQVAEQAGYIGKESAGSVYALIFVFVQSVPIMWYAAAVNRTDRKRAAAEEFVRALLRVGAQLNSTLDVSALLSILATEAARLVSADSARAGLRTAVGMTCQWYFRNGEPLARQSSCSPERELPGWVAQQMDRNRANAERQIDPKLGVRFDNRSTMSAPILDSRGELLGFVEVNKKDGDFTEGDQERLSAVAQSAASAVQNAMAYQHVQEAERALKAADRHKDEFLATLAHELRNPLAPLRNGLQIMRLAGSNWEAVEQARAMMERQLGQMTRLIDDLLDLSRISRGKIELRRERVELAVAVRQAAETSSPVIKQAGHALTIDLPPEPIHVDADVTRLAQVFANLLNNSAKFTALGGNIQLTVARHGDEAVVSVRDNGVGIPAEMLPRVFDMFTQVDRSLERSQGGLGIGLSLVKGLIEMHGGRVEAASPGPGMGSEFVVRLPVVAPPVGKRSIGGDEAIQTAGRRVLVVDDNQDAAASLAMLLTTMGNETRTAHDGLAALEVCAAFRPDVVLLDIGMPKLNGYDTARRIRQKPWGQDVTLVALTGWGQDEARRRSSEAGFDHHAVKPVEPAALAKLLTGSVNGQCKTPSRPQLEAG